LTLFIDFANKFILSRQQTTLNYDLYFEVIVSI